MMESLEGDRRAPCVRTGIFGGAKQIRKRSKLSGSVNATALLLGKNVLDTYTIHFYFRRMKRVFRCLEINIVYVYLIDSVENDT